MDGPSGVDGERGKKDGDLCVGKISQIMVTKGHPTRRSYDIPATAGVAQPGSGAVGDRGVQKHVIPEVTFFESSTWVFPIRRSDEP